jgi:hypothetical protein
MLTTVQVLNGEKISNEPVRVDRVPGKEFRYSGGGYVVVQQVDYDPWALDSVVRHGASRRRIRNSSRFEKFNMFGGNALANRNSAQSAQVPQLPQATK